MAEVAAIILAAGQSSRFRQASAIATKLVAPWGSETMLAHVVRMALASRTRPVLVVTGHAREQVEAALSGLPVTFVHNAGFASGLAGSLKTGIAAVPAECAGALVLLGDMPLVRSVTCDALVAAFEAADGETSAVVPVWQGQIGNPPLLARCLFDTIAQLKGDEGARRLFTQAGTNLVRVDVDDSGILADADTPDALAALHAGKD